MTSEDFNGFVETVCQCPSLLKVAGEALQDGSKLLPLFNRTISVLLLASLCEPSQTFEALSVMVAPP